MQGATNRAWSAMLGRSGRGGEGVSHQVEPVAQAAVAPSLLRVIRPAGVAPQLQRTLQQAAGGAAAAQKLLLLPKLQAPPRPPQPVVLPPPPPSPQQEAAGPGAGDAGSSWQEELDIQADEAAALAAEAAQQPEASTSAVAVGLAEPEPLTPVQLAAQIRATSSLQQVVALFYAYQAQLTCSHLHLLLVQMAASKQLRTLGRLQRQQLTVVLQHVTQQLEANPLGVELPPALLAGVPHTLVVRLRYLPPADWLQALMAQAYKQLDSFSVEEMTQLIQAAAALRPIAAAPGRRAPSPGAAPSAAAAPAARASASSAHDSADAMASSYGVSSAWLRRYMSVLEQRLGRRATVVTADQLHAIGVSLASLGASPPRSLLYVYVRALSGAMVQAQPAWLVRILTALAQWQYRLPSHVEAQFQRQVSGSLAQLRPAELVSALHALAVLRHKPEEAWTDSLLSAVLRGSCHLNAQAVAMLVAAAAMSGYEIQHDALDVLLLQARQALHLLSAPECIGLIDALSQQQHRPGPGFMAAYMDQAQRHLPALSFEQLAALIAGVADAAYKPQPQWMAEYMRALSVHAPAPGDVPALMRLLGALQKLQYTPPGDVFGRLEAQIDALALQLDLEPIQRLRAALDALQYESYTQATMLAAEAAAAAAAAEAEAAAAGVEDAASLLEAAAVGALAAAAAGAEEAPQDGAGAGEQPAGADATVDGEASELELLA